MRPRCSVLTGGFDFSGCGDCTCPPFEHTEMSISEPSAIALHGIFCMCELYKVSIRMEKTIRSRLACLSSIMAWRHAAHLQPKAEARSRASAFALKSGRRRLQNAFRRWDPMG